MITITPAAAEQIRVSAKQGDMENLPMRIAATRNPDGTLHYGMGFDDNQMDGDMHVTAGEIDIVISESSQVLLEGATLDFVELEPGSFQFIFMNPNDTNYSAPPK